MSMLVNPYPADHDCTVVFGLFYLSIKSLILRAVCMFKNKDLQRIYLKFNEHE